MNNSDLPQGWGPGPWNDNWWVGSFTDKMYWSGDIQAATELEYSETVICEANPYHWLNGLRDKTHRLVESNHPTMVTKQKSKLQTENDVILAAYGYEEFTILQLVEETGYAYGTVANLLKIRCDAGQLIKTRKRRSPIVYKWVPDE